MISLKAKGIKAEAKASEQAWEQRFSPLDEGKGLPKRETLFPDREGDEHRQTVSQGMRANKGGRGGCNRDYGTVSERAMHGVVQKVGIDVDQKGIHERRG